MYLEERFYGNLGHCGCSRRGQRSNGSPSCHTTGMKPKHNCSKDPLPKNQVVFLLRVATPMNWRRHRWKGRQAFNGMIKKPPFNNKSNDNCVWYEQEMASSFIFFFLRRDLKLWQMPGGSVHRQGLCDACQILWPRNLPCSWTGLWFLVGVVHSVCSV